MISPEWSEIINQSMHDLLLWVGFGTLVGLAAKAVMPGRDGGGAITTLIMGICGTIIGCGTMLFFWKDAKLTPISPEGFLAGTAGSFLILFFYRLLSGSILREAEDP